MKPEKEKSENKKCAESCDCSDKKNDGPEIKIAAEENSKKELTLDPTHFGDWQINCRAIDF